MYVCIYVLDICVCLYQVHVKQSFALTNAIDTNAMTVMRCSCGIPFLWHFLRNSLFDFEHRHNSVRAVE